MNQAQNIQIIFCAELQCFAIHLLNSGIKGKVKCPRMLLKAHYHLKMFGEFGHQTAVISAQCAPHPFLNALNRNIWVIGHICPSANCLMSCHRSDTWNQSFCFFTCCAISAGKYNRHLLKPSHKGTQGEFAHIYPVNRKAIQHGAKCMRNIASKGITAAMRCNKQRSIVFIILYSAHHDIEIMRIAPA